MFPPRSNLTSSLFLFSDSGVLTPALDKAVDDAHSEAVGRSLDAHSEAIGRSLDAH